MILNLRPIQHREAFHRDFAGFRLPIIDAPMLQAAPMAGALPPANFFDAVIFTSALTFEFFPVDAWLTKPVFAVGTATAEAARAAGFPSVVCTGENASELSRAFAASPVRRAFYPSAEQPAVDLSEIFPDRIVRQAVYRTDAMTELPPGAREALFAPTFSRRTTLALAEALGAAAPQLTVIGISENAVTVPQRPWGRTLVAANATSASIAQTLSAALHARRAA